MYVYPQPVNEEDLRVLQPAESPMPHEIQHHFSLTQKLRTRGVVTGNRDRQQLIGQLLEI